jgi:hypothetical protein
MYTPLVGINTRITSIYNLLQKHENMTQLLDFNVQYGVQICKHSSRTSLKVQSGRATVTVYKVENSTLTELLQNTQPFNTKSPDNTQNRERGNIKGFD